MRIRSKLTLSFSLLFGLALLSLAGLFYRTFEQSIEPSRQHLFSLRSKSLAAAFDLQLYEALEAVKLFAVRYPVDRLRLSERETALERAIVFARSSEFIAGTPLTDRIVLFDDLGQVELHAGVGDPEAIDYPGLLRRLRTIAPMNDASAAVVAAGGRLYVIVKTLGPDARAYAWMAGLDMDVVAARLRDYFKRNDPEAASVTLAAREQVILSLAKGGETALDDASLAAIETSIEQAMRAPLPHLYYARSYLFPAAVERIPWRVIYRVPNDRYWYGIDDLRLELALLLIGILLLAIYVIYVLALRITRPLQQLQSAARMSSELEFDAPIAVIQSDDEIGDLARTFEIQRRRISRLINRDELTGTHNRRYFIMALSREVARASRNGEPLCVMMIDADHFKSINDRFGHACGDAVLVQLGRTLMAVVREYDVVGRLGGEEFAVLAPGSTLETACGLAERIRDRVARDRCGFRDQAVHITVSIGVAEHDRTAQQGADALLDRADDALYRAKRRGRNCVESAGIAHLSALRSSAIDGAGDEVEA